MKNGGVAEGCTARCCTMQNVWLGMIAITMVLTLVAGAVWCFAYRGCQKFQSVSSELMQGYVGVFLDNGQVYFGKAKASTADFLTMEEIYYLQTDKPAADQNSQQDLKLVKLGNELHGPKDQMEINRQHILFIEGLKDDSKVVKAIRDYKP